ncbi:MAG: LemA family protein [Prolixibacteraceae bacterium]|nr:LemA family protein [Prolixibacteraceae bacterium]
MKKSAWIIIIVFVAILGISCVRSYNNLVSLDVAVEAQWAQVENVYQRRADLIPNLVATVKGYATHEQETLNGVIEARSKASSVHIDPSNMTPEALQQFSQAQDGLTSALSRLMVVVERYPDLKANQNFMDLQAQLEGTENRITVERMKFNEETKSYNTAIKHFPAIIMAKIFGFNERAFFEAQPGAQTAPKVEF